MKKVISIVLVLTMACCNLVGSSCFAAEHSPSVVETQAEVQKTEAKLKFRKQNLSLENGKKRYMLS